jgi:hypothetical protein
VFKFDGNQFISPFKDNKALTVENAKDEEGHNVIVAKNEDQVHQQWKVVYLDKAEKEATKGLNEDFGWYINRPFYIRSRMFFRRVVEAHGNNWLYLRRWVANRKAQQWVFNNVDKVVHNMNWKNYGMSIHSNGNHSHMRMEANPQSRWWQLFHRSGSYVYNDKNGKVLEVQNKDDVEGRHIFINNKVSNRIDQQWDIIYADEWKGEPGKGELNERIGLFVERDFYIIS